jgi:hypothetical protein
VWIAQTPGQHVDVRGALKLTAQLRHKALPHGNVLVRPGQREQHHNECVGERDGRHRDGTRVRILNKIVNGAVVFTLHRRCATIRTIACQSIPEVQMHDARVSALVFAVLVIPSAIAAQQTPAPAGETFTLSGEMMRGYPDLPNPVLALRDRLPPKSPEVEKAQPMVIVMGLLEAMRKSAARCTAEVSVVCVGARRALGLREDHDPGTLVDPRCPGVRLTRWGTAHPGETRC